MTRAGRPLSFLAQVSTADIQVPTGVAGLPADTVLAFFYEAGEQQGWGFHPGDRQFSAVVAVPAADAVAAASPAGALAFPAYRMLRRPVTTIPDHGEPSLDELGADYDVFRRLYAGLDRDDKPPWHRMFGWPDLVQNPMQLECQLASNGIYLGDGKGYRHPRAAELAPGAEDWVLLLQLDTDDKIGWMWGDTGTIYYWIRRQDLLAGFDAAIEPLRTTPVDQATLDRALVKMRSSLYAQMEQFAGFGRANLLASFALFDNDPGKINVLERGFAAVTPAILLKTAQEYLRPTNRTVEFIVPAAKTAASR